MNLDRLFRSFVWAFGLMCVIFVAIIITAAAYGNSLSAGELRHLWQGGAFLRLSMVLYMVLMLGIMLTMCWHEFKTEYLLVPTVPGAAFVSVDATFVAPFLPAMLCYLAAMIYWTLSERERAAPRS